MTELIDIDGSVVAFERKGTGPPMVLFHGGLEYRQVWRKQITGLSDAFTVVACDLPGWGESSDLPEGVGFALYTDLIAQWLDRLGLQGSHVVGGFFGGSLAIDLWDRYPQLVSSLTLMSAYAGWAGSFSPDVVEQLLEDALDVSTRPSGDWVQRYSEALLGPDVGVSTAEEFKAILAESRPQSMRATARAFASLDLNDVLPRIRVPTLILSGDTNQSFLNEAKRLHSLVRESRLEVLRGFGPHLNMEAPDRFNALIREFAEIASGKK